MEAIEAAVKRRDSDEELDSCGQSYFKIGRAGEDIEGHLFAFIKNNKEAIAL